MDTASAKISGQECGQQLQHNGNVEGCDEAARLGIRAELGLASSGCSKVFRLDAMQETEESPCGHPKLYKPWPKSGQNRLTCGFS